MYNYLWCRVSLYGEKNMKMILASFLICCNHKIEKKILLCLNINTVAVAVLNNFAKFIKNRLCLKLFLIMFQAWEPAIKLMKSSLQVLFCEFCEIFKNTYFEEYLKTVNSSKTFEHSVL